ncbi:TPA: hypothetical protein H1016_02665 [archaeon]|uniref:Uncharacterized protein n=1 Tax=Candidatus Naiadarchaeum limnaeum TaxID=2756139 RepID=A0A832VA82_9ARCH|nr:hypothetical protein [Candidatus Naiadarchaeum limnaeum]
MEKKFLFISIMLFTLLTLSSVNAATTVDIKSPKTGTTYNVGDQLVVDGTITLDQTLLGTTVTFKAYSQKYNITIPLAQKIYNFQANVPVTFSQINKGNIIWILARNTQVGTDWQIIIDIDKSPAYATTFESGFFFISKTIPLTTSVNSYMLNIGETLEATGTATTLRGTPANGTGNILLEHSELGTIYSNNTSVIDGFISIRYPFDKGDPTGTYTLTFKIVDSNGNIGFVILTGIVLSDQLKLTCSIPRSEFLPGESFAVTGNLKNIHDAPLEKIPVVAYLTNPNENTAVNFVGTTNGNGNFEIIVGTPKLAQPGQYNLRLVAEDSDGNVGRCEKNFFLNVQRIYVIDFKLDNSWFYNESELGNEVVIVNKGNIDLSGKIVLVLDGVEVTSTDFFVQKGLEATVRPYWIVSGTEGTHTLEAVIRVQNETLYRTEPQFFTIFPKPLPKKILSPSVWQVFIVAGIFVIAILLYLKKKDIRDHFWHWELKRKYGIGK